MNDEASLTPVQLDVIGQIAITVSDLARSKDFYQNTLGIRFLFDAGPMSFLQCGSIRLALGTSTNPPAPGGTILYFRVVDIRQTYASLVAKGVKFMQEPHPIARMPDHDLWLAFLLDPDKNPIGLMSEMPHAPAQSQ